MNGSSAVKNPITNSVFRMEQTCAYEVESMVYKCRMGHCVFILLYLADYYKQRSISHDLFGKWQGSLFRGHHLDTE